MASLGTNTVLTLSMGEALVDLIGQENSSAYVGHNGGAVYNLARALAAQGIRSVYANPLSSDRFGQQLRAGLVQYKVELGSDAPVHQPTSLAIASLNSTGQAQYAFYRDGVADKAISVDRLKSITSLLFTRNQNNWALTGCLALAPDFIDTTVAWLTKCKTLGATIAVDVNLRPVVVADSGGYRNAVMRSLAFADVIKASDEDMNWLFDNQFDPLQNAQILLKKTTAKVLAITCGAKGAYLIARASSQPTTSRGAQQLEPQTIYARDHATFTVIDTVGAGDCFFAGLVASLAPVVACSTPLGQLSSVHLETAIRTAIACASLNVQQAGCQPPDKLQVSHWIEQHTIQIEFV